MGFTARRMARPGAEPPAYTDPAPSPDGTLLAWISDRDGRPLGARPCGWCAPTGPRCATSRPGPRP